MSAEPQYIHEALFFSSSAGLVEAATPFLREGLAAGEDAVLVCTDAHNQALTEALGDDPRVTVLPRPEVYGRAVSAVAFYRDFMRSRLRGGTERVRLVNEVDFGSSSAAWDEWRRFEALCNHALAPFPLWSLCAYDSAALSDPVLVTGELTHPYVRTRGAQTANPVYVDPAELMRLPATDLEPAPDVVPALSASVSDPHDLQPLHQRLRDLLHDERVAGEVVEDLVLSVHEVATNGVRHGETPVEVNVWLSTGRVVCTITDRGRGFDDPFAGYRPGSGEIVPEGRFGLWLARRLCDDLVTAQTPDGFTVRLVRRH
ncbi:sensor histidine kinase [Nocardioides mesophilus]|uniref:Sensor histidine kinase n=1 Tax=Nocardioides mesophilus TaxID=433659 RepID=A0A7G9RFL2_9ACTN|nr:sensor histidine kinase [Nocardioides mesophilus]QNN54387.1 sensor histidine kinase [Nocardioides mesophilus]